MNALLIGLSLLSLPPAPQAKILSVCFDDVSKEFLVQSTALGTTPNLTRFADRGMTFENFYGAPLCSTSRARFILGRYHTGVGNNFKPEEPLQWSMDPRGAFPPSLPGVKLHVGKWHLAGTGDLAHPLRCGFDGWQGSFRNLEDYWRWELSSPWGSEVSHEYATMWATRVAREQLSYADFLSVSLNAAHLPLHEPPPDLHSFGDLTGASKKELSLAMLEAADTLVGPLVDDALARDFLVFLWGDNGGPAWGKKGTMHESALNTWLIVLGEGVQQGTTAELVDQVDFAATFSELMGGTFASPDSRSFAPLLRGNPPPSGHREWVYCESYETDRLPPPSQRTRAIRDRRWKLIVSPDPLPHELYDLATDPEEEVNLWPSTDPTLRRVHARLLSSMP